MAWKLGRLIGAATLVALAGGCAGQSAQMVKEDPDQPKMAFTTAKAPRDAYQAIEAAFVRCNRDAESIKGSFVDARNSGQLSYSTGHFLVTVIDVEPRAEGGAAITVYPNIHRSKQERTWPALIEAWVERGDQDACISDML